MALYAINADLTIEHLNNFSTPSGDELAWGIAHKALFAQHPHAIALEEALKAHGPTEHEYEVNYASASTSGPTRICLTCTDPDEGMGHCDEHRRLIDAAGLSIADGIMDESGDHALVEIQDE